MKVKNEIGKSLKEMKKFIISEMKRESANWYKYNDTDDKNVFKSEYIKISLLNNKWFISFNDLRGLYSLKDVGISNIRFYLLFRNVKKFSNRRVEIKRKIDVSDTWEKFLYRNKDLNRNRKLDDILKK